MNIVQTLTLRHLKQNKRRTLVTIIGVIISVAMITAVATLGLSFMDLMQRAIIASEGEWQVRFTDVNAAQIKSIKQNANTKDIFLYQDLGYALLEESENIEKPYLFIQALDNRGFTEKHVQLTSGRLPQNRNEIIVSDAIEQNGGVQYRIGDVVTYPIGHRQLIHQDSASSSNDNEPLGQNTSYQNVGNGINREVWVPEKNMTFTVVGTFARPDFEFPWAAGYTVLTSLSGDNIPKDEKGTIAITVNKLNRSLYTSCYELAGQLDIPRDRVEFHENLLRWYGIIHDDEINKTLYGFIGILLIIIVLGSITLIYNAFSISVAERSRHLGMLSSVGATKIQKRNSVFFEGAVIALISVPLGILAGLAGISITFLLVNPLVVNSLVANDIGGFRLVISHLSLVGAICLSCITIFVSTWIPARRASKASAIDAIRQAKDVKLTRRVVKTSRFTRKLFGIEGELGLKNIKRNRGRYYAIVLSLAVSVVLFLGVSAFSLYMNQSVEMASDGIRYDVIATFSQICGSEESFDAALDSIGHLEQAAHIKEKSLLTSLDFETILQPQQVPKYYRDLGLDEGEQGSHCKVYLYGMDAQTLQKYAEEVGVEPTLFLDPQQQACIIINEVNYRSNGGKTYVQTEALHAKVGDILPALAKDETGKQLPMPEISIAGLTKTVPAGIINRGTSGVIIGITSQETMRKYAKLVQNQSIQFDLIMTSDNPLALQDELNKIRDNMKGNGDFYIMNLYQAHQQQNQLTILVKVFTYGFVILIMAICVANIFNTISTGIALRRREFAMLKSVGMTPESFHRMIAYESIFYGLKALLYGLPLGIGLMWLMYRALGSNFAFSFSLPWINIAFMIIVVFAIVSITMVYAFHRTKNENIVEVLKQENI